MSVLESEVVYSTPRQQVFVWDERRSEAAIVLAAGGTKTEAAVAANVDRSTIYDWLKYPEFCAEIDRLSLMVSVSSRAERLRHAMRVIKSRIGEDEVLRSDKDALDWLKFAQSETDGAKIDMSKLAELLAGESNVDHTSNGVGQAQLLPAIEVEASSGQGLTSQSQEVADEPELNAS